MKIWLKYVLGCLLGIIASAVLPLESASVQKVLSFLTEFAVRFGRFTLLPLLFFSMVVAVFNLRDSNLLLKTAFQTVFMVVMSSLVLVVLALVSAVIIKLPRIPISVEKVSETVNLDIPARLLQLFPFAGFDSFLDGAYLLPLFVLAGFAGAGCASDKAASKPAVNLFDSLSKLSYSVMSFFIDMLAVGLIAISCTWFIQFKGVILSGVFTPLILLLAGNLIVVTLLMYPLIMRFVFKEMHPYRVMYASVSSIITAFFSGDTNLVLPINIRHAKESLGVKRRLNAVTLPVFSTFARGGSALVTAISFIIILRSYSSLGVSLSDVLWIGLISFILSFFLGAFPAGGTFVSLTLLCTLYGRGFDAGYLLLKPMAVVLGSFAAAIDAATAMAGSYIIASKMKMTEHRELKKFI
ncbi:MAG TPA: cation:dicarboxylase symporter family transporter [Treponemataceae bacterium]|nr:cation:dicarboxylase symporter family transporter [Treponemataceae bacterium]